MGIHEGLEPHEHVAYPPPTLPVELLPEPQRTAQIGWLAGAIDADGRVAESRIGKDKIGRIDRAIYKYEYQRPIVRFASTTKDMTDKFDTLVEAQARWTQLTPEKLPYYVAEVAASKALKLLILTEPYLVKWKQKAKELIEKYKTRPETPLHS